MHPVKGITLKLCAVMMFIIMASLIKATADHVPAGEAVFFRSFFALPIILGWLVMRGDLSTGLKVNSPMGHFWRGFVGTAAMGLSFLALGLLPLPEATALGYAAPLLTVIFAAMFLDEKVGMFRIGAVLLGLAGVIIVLSPRLSTFAGESVETMQAVGALCALMGATCAALAQIYIRKMVATEQTSAIVFYFTVTSTLLSLITLPFGWVMPEPRELVLLISAGLLGGMGQIFLTSSYRFAHASVVAPFDYASMIFALGIGYLVFDEVPTGTMLAGAALVILAGIIIILRERQLGLKEGRARARSIRTPQG
ncbi:MULTISPECIES: DMT family transporter [Roseovarius]|uniref:DMT family transporter n=1 Tax=Roseovarius TaxID=74030 RepID=UPI001C091A7B|nr:DMT family transporter [Roseovarius nubinhibens]MBU3000052.1 DMT family transporter [Roseovarius nubinhibens]